MYTMLRKVPVEGGYVYNIADWSDNTVDTLTKSEVSDCMNLGFEIEGKFLAPKQLGTDRIFTLEDSAKIGARVSVVVSTNELEGTVCVSFRVEGKPYYFNGSVSNMAIVQPVTSVISTPEYDEVKGKYINKRIRIDKVSVSYMKLLNTDAEYPLFDLVMLGTDGSTGECFCKDYILEYNPEYQHFRYTGSSSWRVQDDSDKVVPDFSTRTLRLSKSGKSVYVWG